MTEQSDKPSVDGLMALVHQYKHDWHHSEEAGEASEKLVRAYAERLAALAGPLEQPQEPTSDKENLAQASGVCDLQTALAENCTHAAVSVSFDKDAARDLDVHEIRRRWPRFHGVCPTCHCQLIKYASTEHYYSGDW